MTATEAQANLDDIAHSCRCLWVKVLRNAIEDDIREQNKTGRGVDNMSRWLNSRNGYEVLSLAGLHPCDRVIDKIVERVRSGITMTPKGLKREFRREPQ